MTDEIKSAIDTLKTMYPKKCKIVDGRLTGGYDDYESEKGQSITSAIRSLNAWEEVLQELEKENIFWTRQAFKHKDDEFAEGKAFGLSKAIDIIKQKLAEIEE